MGDEPTNDPAAPHPPEGPRPSWSAPDGPDAGPTPGSPPPYASDGIPPDAPGGATPPPQVGAGPVPADGDLWGERGDASAPATPSKPLSTSTKAWIGAGVGAAAIVGAALFGVNAAGSTPSNSPTAPIAYETPRSGAPEGYGVPGGTGTTGPQGGYGVPGGAQGSSGSSGEQRGARNCGPGMEQGGPGQGSPGARQQPPSEQGGSGTPSQGSTESTSTRTGTV